MQTDQGEQTEQTGGVERLEEERWRSRPVLVFADAGQEALRVAQQQVFDAVSAGLRERDITVYVVTPEGVTRDGEALAGDGQKLRSRYGVTREAWAVVLVGKDGGEKLRVTDGVLDTERLFGVIDAMPMRRAEMERRR
ncbi:MAG: DUF4174 domain-containing protein [Planctomycetota bacterium]